MNCDILDHFSEADRLNLFMIFVFIALGIVFQRRFPQFGENYGFWSVGPPPVAIILAL
jgi:hypothetical protein